MLRRVTRVLRVSLCAFSVLLLLWLPASFVLDAYLQYLGETNSAGVGTSDGCVTVWHDSLVGWSDSSWRAGVAPRTDGFPISWRKVLLPTFEKAGLVVPQAVYAPANVSIPLWLLAALCLAWPVTSFLVARRRQRTARGFEIAAVGEEEE